MEILFMAFMVIVSVMALFAVIVVFRDVIREILSARKVKSAVDEDLIKQLEKIIANAESKSAVAKIEEALNPAPAEELCVTAVCESSSAPVLEKTPAEPVSAEDESSDGTISFSMGQQKTLDEKYLELPSEQRGWYDAIIKYASAIEGSKRFKNARYEEYKIGNSRIVRLLIKRGIIQCEFILHNSDFKSYVNENKINVRQAATTILIESPATVEVARNSIDIVVAAIAEEKEYKKQLAKKKRRAARAQANQNN